MSNIARIVPEMTVREVNAKYPACREVFNKHGMGGCGGQYGPPEPIDFFARAHNVSIDELIADLEAAASAGTKATGETDAEKLSGVIYKRFVKAALFFTLTLGTAWGVQNLTMIALNRSFDAPYYAAIQGHGHAQTLGWVGLFIMGVAYYTLPKFKGTTLRFPRLALATLPVMILGIVTRALAQPFARDAVFGFLTFAASIVEIAAIGVFVFIMLDTVRRSEQPRDFYEKYVYAGLVWFVTLGGLNIAATWHLWTSVADIVPPEYNLRILHTQVFGFIVNIILGVSLRILPNFMGLRQPLQRTANTAFWLFNAGVTLRVTGAGPLAMSSAFELAGILLFIRSLGVFAKPVTSVAIQGVDNAYTWFVKLGYVWLAITGLLIFAGDVYQSLTGTAPAHAYVGAYRHAVTVGFISTLMIGVAYRVLPIFNGTELYSARAMRASFWLLAVGNLFRVGWQLGTLSGSPVAYAGTGISGYLELTAMGIFAWNIVKTLRDREDVFLQDHIIRPSTRVADLLDLYPETRLALIEAGFSHLAAIPRPPRFVTLGFASKRHGLDPDVVAAKLNQIIHKEEAIA
ncbi:MAG: NnrS family protein [Armatimonadota bacterium]|nr:NnrS family protein [Armatimonadota bacterium]